MSAALWQSVIVRFWTSHSRRSCAITQGVIVLAVVLHPDISIIFDLVDGGLSASPPLWCVSRLTLAGAEGEHGRLALACRIPSHHQHLVQTGGLQVRQM